MDRTEFWKNKLGKELDVSGRFSKKSTKLAGMHKYPRACFMRHGDSVIGRGLAAIYAGFVSGQSLATKACFVKCVHAILSYYSGTYIFL